MDRGRIIFRFWFSKDIVFGSIVPLCGDDELGLIFVGAFVISNEIEFCAETELSLINCKVSFGLKGLAQLIYGYGLNYQGKNSYFKCIL